MEIESNREGERREREREEREKKKERLLDILKDRQMMERENYKNGEMLQ